VLILKENELKEILEKIDSLADVAKQLNHLLKDILNEETVPVAIKEKYLLKYDETFKSVLETNTTLKSVF
jgi:hypothetical protein